MDTQEEIYREAGLVPSGINKDGEMEWIGTKQQFRKAEQMIELEEMTNAHEHGSF